MIDVCRRRNSGTPPIYGTGSNETFFVRVNILIHLIDFLFLFVSHQSSSVTLYKFTVCLMNILSALEKHCNSRTSWF